MIDGYTLAEGPLGLLALQARGTGQGRFTSQSFTEEPPGGAASLGLLGTQTHTLDETHLLVLVKVQVEGRQLCGLPSDECRGRKHRLLASGSLLEYGNGWEDEMSVMRLSANASEGACLS